MKELLKQPLTSVLEKPYANGGDISMEVGEDMPQSTNPNTPNPERIEHSLSDDVEPKDGDQNHKPVEQERISKEAKNKQASSEQKVDREKLRNEWYATFTKEELKNADTRATIEAAIDLGFAPQSVTSKGPIEFKAKDVIANSLLDDDQRIEKAEEILGQLSEKQKTALLKAHRASKGKIGKSGQAAGVYNLKPEQLAEEVEILVNEGGFTDAQRRTIIESGLAATPIPNIPSYTDPILQGIVLQYTIEESRINAIDSSQHIDPNFLMRQIHRIEELVDGGRVDAIQARNLLNELQVIFTAENPSRSGAREGMWFKLRTADMNILDDDGGIVKWMNQQFDTIYEASKGKDPLKSSITGDINQAYGEAGRYLQISGRLDAVRELSDLWDTRIRLMQMASAIGTKNLEQVHQAAGDLTARGLLFGLTLDQKRVGSMFNRLAERLEDTRLDKREGYGGYRQHVSPEMLQYLQDGAIEEQVSLAVAGVGDFADIYLNTTGTDAQKREATQTEVTRSVRSAYDILVSTQRVAVIAARGRNLLGTDAFFSDPGSTFNMFNFGAFTTDKWAMFNAEDEQFLSHIREGLVEDYINEKKEDIKKIEVDNGLTHAQKDNKINIIRRNLTITNEERIDLGKRLLRDMGLVPDFFSSGWRMKGITDQLRRYFAYRGWDEAEANAENFALFMRLRQPKTYEERSKEEIWELIKKYRPEEIIKLLHERWSDNEKTDMNNVIFSPHGIANYDIFKEKYGAVLRALREEGFKADTPVQIDFSTLSTPQRDMIERVIPGGANIVESMFREMKNFITDNNVIEQLVNNSRFADIYGRTLNADDTLLDRLEDVPENSGMLPLSRIWGGAEVGNDALVRNMNDIIAAKKQFEAFVGFVKIEGEEEKLKQAETSAAAAAEHSGRLIEATILRHTIITYMELTEIPGLLDALGIAKLPLRIPMTEIEKIYGPSAKPLSQAERRAMVDKIRVRLMGAAKNSIEETEADTEKQLGEIDTDATLTPDQKEEKKRFVIIQGKNKKLEASQKAESIYERAEDVLHVSGEDRAKQRLLDILITLLLWALVEGVRATGVTEIAKKAA